MAARGPVASPCTSSTGSGPLKRRAALPLTCGEVEVGYQCQAEPTLLAGLHPMVNSVTNVHIIASLQSELANLKRMVNNLVNSEAELWQENIMLQEWFKVLLALKDKMMVTVLALVANMKGLQDGMDLEKMKAELEMLWKQPELYTPPPVPGRILPSPSET